MPFSRDCIGTYLKAVISDLIFASTDDPNFKEINGYAGNCGLVTVVGGSGRRSPGNAAAGTTSQSSSSLSGWGAVAEPEAVGWGRRVSNSLRRPDSTLSVTRSTRASSLDGIELPPASALDVVAAARRKTAPGRFVRLDVRVFGMLQQQ